MLLLRMQGTPDVKGREVSPRKTWISAQGRGNGAAVCSWTRRAISRTKGSMSPSDAAAYVPRQLAYHQRHLAGAQHEVIRAAIGHPIEKGRDQV